MSYDRGRASCCGWCDVMCAPGGTLSAWGKKVCLCVWNCITQGIGYGQISAEGIKNIMSSYASQCILILYIY